MRMYDLGIRGFMSVDRGLLRLIKTMQEQGNFPTDVAIKMSVWTGVSLSYPPIYLTKMPLHICRPAGEPGNRQVVGSSPG